MTSNRVNLWTSEELNLLKNLLEPLSVTPFIQQPIYGITDEGDPYVMCAGDDGSIALSVCRINEQVFAAYGSVLEVELESADLPSLVSQVSHALLQHKAA